MSNSHPIGENAEILSVYWEDDRLYFLDQTLLPVSMVREEQITIEQIWSSIRQLKVRGAPAIGIAGAYGLYIGARGHAELPIEEFMEKLRELAAYLSSSRPTAVNLSWGLKRMIAIAESSVLSGSNTARVIEGLKKEAETIHQEDQELCRAIGEAGRPLIKNGMGVQTHCNAGGLATSVLGTATAPMYLAHRQGVSFRVYAGETRPLLQGARLTSWELLRAGIDVILICDNMAASLMASGKVNLLIVGADRVVANGDVANKIGTYGLAILAKHFDIPFYVACPSSTIDLDTATGSAIPIEERGSEEVTDFGARQTGPDNVNVWNPAFDVTPARYITGIITEEGILTAPYSENLRNLFKRS